MEETQGMILNLRLRLPCIWIVDFLEVVHVHKASNSYLFICDVVGKGIFADFILYYKGYDSM